MELGKDLKVIIFDFDGTLHSLAMDWQAARSAVGIAGSSESLGNAIERLKAQDNNEVLAELRDLEARALSSERLNKETKQTLLALHKKYRIAIYSRNSSKVISNFLQRDDIKVDYIIGREDVDRLKPHPEGLERILHHFGFRSEEALLVGDTWHDLLVARAANMPCIIVGENYAHDTEEPECRIKTVSELVALLH